MGELVNGLSLVGVVMALVEWIKKFGVEGKALSGVSMGVGLVVGVLYQMSLGMPAGLSGWFGAALYGVALGLTASGLYDTGKSMLRGAMDASTPVGW